MGPSRYGNFPCTGDFVPFNARNSAPLQGHVLKSGFVPVPRPNITKDRCIYSGVSLSSALSSMSRTNHPSSWQQDAYQSHTSQDISILLAILLPGRPPVDQFSYRQWCNSKGGQVLDRGCSILFDILCRWATLQCPSHSCPV